MRLSGENHEIIHEPVRAIDSHILPKVIEETEAQRNLLAYTRLAMIGGMKYENCHPYTGRDETGRTWTMINNGTIYSSKTLMKYLDVQKGDTDSERVFLYLLDLLNEEYILAGTLTAQQRFGGDEYLKTS